MDESWFDNAFQMFDATDENDFEADMVVLRGDNDEEERSARVGT